MGSIAEPQSHIALTVTPKLYENLCSFNWLKPKRSLVRNFIPTCSYAEKIERLFDFMKLSSSVLNFANNSVFLILLSNFFDTVWEK